MKIYEPGPGEYDYKYFPAFAKFLLVNHLEEYVRHQMKLARHYSLPLLKHLSHLSEEQILEFGKQTTIEYLTFIANNQIAMQIRNAMQKWQSDMLQVIGKFDVGAEDITIINFMRGRSFRKFAMSYDITPEERYMLFDEIDHFLFASVTSATNVFIDLLKNKIEAELRHNSALIVNLKKVESVLLEKTKELERSNESLQQFASVASHDLKEPLRKMSMYTDLVLMQEEGRISDSSKVNLEKVKSSSMRMQKMIDDILNFSTLNTAGQFERIGLERIVNDAKVILEETIHEKRVRIEHGELPEINVVPSQFRQLFQNLFSNAIKFSRPGGPVVIEVSAREIASADKINDIVNPARKYVEVRVKDNGIGFRQENAEKIFGMFTRLHPRGEYDGNGLGLSICRRIVENHGGSIRAEGSPNEGSVFTILIPSGADAGK